jgi:hypothetical protein
MCPGGGTAEADGYLRIAPNSFYDDKQAIANDDISYKLLYGYDAASGKPKVNVYKDILDNLPRISIREYLQDAKLDQVMNLFSSLSKGFEAGSAAAAKVDDEESQRRGFLEKFTGVVGQAVNGGSVLLRNIGKVMADIFADIFEKAKITTQGSLNENNLANYVLRLPYMLYYRMLSATTTNVYEIPYNGQILYESSGGGWNTKRHLIDGVDGSENSALGVLRNFIGKNIRANTTPTWDGASDETGIKVDVEFSLFNDSVDAAVKNFIFTNTIVPGNMWMQYHVFQHAPNLYDIRIEGIKRLFMCQGDFKVETMGVLRKPSKEFFKRLDKHLNSGIKLTASDMEDLIKIPDIYKVTCSFTSLLPNNFNNYLYSYYNNSTISKIEKKEDLHTPSLLDPAINKAAEEIAAIFQYPNVA